MRPAHQGVPVAALPGVPSGVLSAGLFPQFGRQPAAAPNADSEVRSATAGSGIDTWLIDRLFGRR
jgi:predicted membrane protein